jgi:diguanylate cyclase (GGDEF)-like protein
MKYQCAPLRVSFALWKGLLRKGFLNGLDELALFCAPLLVPRRRMAACHFEGDPALKRTGAVLEETFRHSDVLARLGGDEFAVLAVEASGRSEATIKTQLFECLKSISAKPSRYEISFSIGLARFDPCSRTSIGELMAKADHAMYELKRRRSRPLLETETST